MFRARRCAIHTFPAVDVSGLGSAVTNVTAPRLQLDVAMGTLDRSLDTGRDGRGSLATPDAVDSLSVSEPPGLTFSPAGLSPGRSSRFVADL